ncbi:BnaA01g33810D [Brassica napus]|uniref:BnaA01g33810D protein n=1 Tax=Brassica napus TaxID=3708 RepID=A0A078G3U2_BRANA|nr:BnaA01g33810D [Brassica napus]
MKKPPEKVNKAFRWPKDQPLPVYMAPSSSSNTTLLLK